MQLKEMMISAVIATAGLNALAKRESPSLCNSEEKAIFSCLVRGSAKVISLCGSKALTRDDGYIQYRFGRPGKIELEFPESTKDTQQKFRYAHYSRFQVDRTEVTFDVNQHSYTVFDSFEGDEKAVERVRGISIALPNKDKRELQCGSDMIGNLADLEPIAACDKDSPLNMGGCPVK